VGYSQVPKVFTTLQNLWNDKCLSQLSRVLGKIILGGCKYLQPKKLQVFSEITSGYFSNTQVELQPSKCLPKLVRHIQHALKRNYRCLPVFTLNQLNNLLHFW